MSIFTRYNVEIFCTAKKNVCSAFCNDLEFLRTVRVHIGYICRVLIYAVPIQ